MPTYIATSDIDASIETVWQLLSQVHAWPQWLPTVTKVEVLEGQDLAVGRRFIVHQPKLRPAVWIVTELDPSASFTWQAQSPGLLMVASHTLGPRSAHQTQLTLRFSFTGLLGPVMGLFFRSLTTSYLSQEAAALKKRSEQLR